MIIYIIILVVFAVPTGAIVYHLSKFGLKKDLSKLMLTIFLVGAAIFLGLALFLVLTIDYDQLGTELPVELHFQQLDL